MRVCSGAGRCPPLPGLAWPCRTVLEVLGLATAGLKMQLAVCPWNSLLA